MRRIKEVKIDGFRGVVVKELRTRDYRELIDRTQTLEEINQTAGLIGLLSDLTPQEIDELAPSEIKLVMDAIMEVNADFLGLGAWLGLTKEKIRTVLAAYTDNVMQSVLRKPSAPSLSVGTSTPGIME